ncbi:hypothetical protein HWV62_13521 [Athelia sp. TMB]|nr:hypothetical protein HWV62_13521 [Athelia sp. TMB]
MVASQSDSAPLITVFGATGNMGGSTVTHLLASDKPYRIRAITRSPEQAKSKELALKGVEVVKGDFESESELTEAIKGADYVFLAVNTWAVGPEKEKVYTERALDIIKKEHVKMLYYSSLPAVKGPSKGKYTQVEHFDVKAELAEHARSLGIPLVEVIPAAFFENNLTNPPKKQPNGTYAFAFPGDPSHNYQHFNCARDYGTFVRGAIESDVAAGGEVYAYSENMTFEEMAKQWGETTGHHAAFFSAPREQFAKWTNEDFTQMFEWISEYGCEPFTFLSLPSTIE